MRASSFLSEPVSPTEAAERAMGGRRPSCHVLESIFNKLTFVTAALLQANQSNHRSGTK